MSEGFAPQHGRQERRRPPRSVLQCLRRILTVDAEAKVYADTHAPEGGRDREDPGVNVH